jgi:Yip1 domain
MGVAPGAGLMRRSETSKGDFRRQAKRWYAPAMADAAPPPPSPRLLSAPSGGPIVTRLGSALMLRREFFASIADDETGTSPAGAIIILIGLIRGGPFLYELIQSEPAWWGLGLVLVVLFAVARWLVVALVALGIVKLSRDASDYRRLLRVLCYADAPTMFIALGAWLPPTSELFYLPDIALHLWAFAATTTALHAATRCSFRRAAVLAVPVYLVQRITLGLLQ